MNRRYKSGFTLLELLVAISIFSILSVMAYGGLKTVLDARDASKKVAERIAVSQIAMLRLANDLRQTVNRTVRDGFGTSVPEMLTSQSGDNALEWTRAGYSNPEKLQRSNLHRIAYKLEDNKLVRVAWSVLDRAQDTEPSESVLLSDIESLEWRFNVAAGNWSSSWPATPAPVEPISLPRAVEVTITFSDLGKVRRLILLPQV